MLWVKGSGSDLATITPAVSPDCGSTRSCRCRARVDDRRGDGRVPRPLPARARDAARLDRDAAACLRARTPTSTTRIPTRSARSSARPTASASPRSASARMRSGSRTSAPGFALSKLVAEAVAERSRGEARAAREARARHLGRHRGGVVRGDARRDQPRGGVRRRAHGGAVAVRRRSAEPLEGERRDELLAEVLPALRGAVSLDGPADPPGRHVADACSEFACGAESRRAVAGRRRVPRPPRAHDAAGRVWVDFDPATEDAAALRERARRSACASGRSASARTSTRYRDGRRAERPEPARRA